jgi:hypothetical protein
VAACVPPEDARCRSSAAVGELALAGADRQVEAVLGRCQRTGPARVVRARRVVGVVEVERDAGWVAEVGERELEPARERALDRVGQVAPGAVGLLGRRGIAKREEEVAAVALGPEQGQLAPRRRQATEAAVADDAVLAAGVDRELTSVGGPELALDPRLRIELEVVEAVKGGLLLVVERRRRVLAKELIATAAKLGDRVLAGAGDPEIELGDGSPPVGELERRPGIGGAQPAARSSSPATSPSSGP